MRYNLVAHRRGAQSGERGRVVDCGTVLVVDADDVWRSATAALLTRVGHDTIGAATAADALELARRERPSLVVLDVALPDLDGYEVCRELRDVYGDKLPIILVSADRNEPHDCIAALLIGADDYLAKPYNPGELLARVHRHLIIKIDVVAVRNWRGLRQSRSRTEQKRHQDRHPFETVKHDSSLTVLTAISF